MVIRDLAVFAGKSNVVNWVECLKIICHLDVLENATFLEIQGKHLGYTKDMC